MPPYFNQTKTTRITAGVLSMHGGTVAPLPLARQHSSAAPTYRSAQNRLHLWAVGMAGRFCRTIPSGATVPYCRATMNGALRAFCRASLCRCLERPAFVSWWRDCTDLSRHPGWRDKCHPETRQGIVVTFLLPSILPCCCFATSRPVYSMQKSMTQFSQ